MVSSQKKLLSDFFTGKFGFRKTLLTSSCTDALEMAAILCNISPGSYTFVSTANAFALRGAKLVFADSLSDLPNIDPAEIERLITSKTINRTAYHFQNQGYCCSSLRRHRLHDG